MVNTVNTWLHLELTAEETSAAGALSAEQLKNLQHDVEFIENKYLHITADEVVGVAIQWAKLSGPLTADSIADAAHKLLSEDEDWAAVKADSVERLAWMIIDHADDVVDGIARERCERRCDFDDVAKWWDFVNAWGKEAFVAALASLLRQKNHAVGVEYNGEKYVVLEVCEKLPSIM